MCLASVRGPEAGKRDKIFGFAPGSGVHDIPINQGNHASFRDDDGVDQDGAPMPESPDGAVRIVGALANAIRSPEVETVTLLNTTAQPIDLAGRKLLDRDKHAMALSGVIPAGETLRITLIPPAVLPNKGSLIIILNDDGLRVDGVRYTKVQASAPGYTIKF